MDSIEPTDLFPRGKIDHTDGKNRDYYIQELINEISELKDRISNLSKAASKMVQAYDPSYENEWMYDDGYGVSHRRNWENDEKVRENLQKAIEKYGTMADAE